MQARQLVFPKFQTGFWKLPPSLTGIFNQSLVTGIFSSDWKLAKLSPIFKNGFKSDLNNYRPISVIPTVAIIFEKIIYDQLYHYLNENCFIKQQPVWLPLAT